MKDTDEYDALVEAERVLRDEYTAQRSYMLQMRLNGHPTKPNARAEQAIAEARMKIKTAKQAVKESQP